MKRILCSLLVISMFFMFNACSNKAQDINNPITFYYRASNITFDMQSSVIASEIREANNRRNDYMYLLEQYFNGPQSLICSSPFPVGTSLEEINYTKDGMELILSSHISTISGIDLLIACACITKTVTELTGIQSVQISTATKPLNNIEIGSISPNDFVYWDVSRALSSCRNYH